MRMHLVTSSSAEANLQKCGMAPYLDPALPTVGWWGAPSFWGVAMLRPKCHDLSTDAFCRARKARKYMILSLLQRSDANEIRKRFELTSSSDLRMRSVR